MSRAQHNKLYDAPDRQIHRDGILSRRPYRVSIVLWEVFFRTRLGERYYNGRPFLGCVLFLGVCRIVCDYGQLQTNIAGYSYPSAHFYDAWLTLFILFSVGHFMSYGRRRKERNTSSMSAGVSRFTRIFTLFGVKFFAAQKFSVRWVEPIVVLCIGVLVLPVAPFATLVCIYSAFTLGYYNNKLVMAERQRELDYIDSRYVSIQLEDYDAPLNPQPEKQQQKAPKMERSRKAGQPKAKGRNSKTLGEMFENLPGSLKKKNSKK